MVVPFALHIETSAHLNLLGFLSLLLVKRVILFGQYARGATVNCWNGATALLIFLRRHQPLLTVEDAEHLLNFDHPFNFVLVATHVRLSYGQLRLVTLIGKRAVNHPVRYVALADGHGAARSIEDATIISLLVDGVVVLDGIRPIPPIIRLVQRFLAESCLIEQVLLHDGQLALPL